MIEYLDIKCTVCLNLLREDPFYSDGFICDKCMSYFYSDLEFCGIALSLKEDSFANIIDNNGKIQFSFTKSFGIPIKQVNLDLNYSDYSSSIDQYNLIKKILENLEFY